MGQVCITVPETCDECYSMELTTASSFNIPAGLTPAATYYLWVRDKFGNLYQDTIVVNGDGSFDIQTGDFPDGLFNIYAGAFTVFLSTDTEGLELVPMNFSMTMWSCLQFTVTDCPAYAEEQDDSDDNYYLSSPDNTLYTPE